MNGLIGAALKSKHTTYPAAICASIKIIKAQACIQWPQYWGAINGWCEALEGVCLLWMGGAAVAIGQAVTPEQLRDLADKTADAIRSGNTTQIEKKP